jgi:RNA recognition motif-containing protein
MDPEPAPAAEAAPAPVAAVPVEICAVHIGNLPASTTEADLVHLFERYGKIRTPRLARSANGQCRGFAFVDFESVSAAESAISALHNTEFKSLRISVERARHKWGDNPRLKARSRDPPRREYRDSDYWDDNRRYGRDQYREYGSRNRYEPARREYSPPRRDYDYDYYYQDPPRRY